MTNVYNAIQNLYNMDKETWQEVLSEMYTLVNNTSLKFDTFEQKFLLHLGNEVTKELKKMYANGSLASLINDVLLQDINEQLDTKASKNEVFSMANMGQDIKEAMTGGSVAVVGKNTVLNENIVNEQITYNKTNYVKTGKNLYNKDLCVDGYYYSGQDGNKYNNEYMSCIEFISVTPSTTYTFNQDNAVQIAYLDINSNFLSGKLFEVGQSTSFTTPSNCYYIHLSVLKSLKNSGQLELGTAKTSYEPYFNKFANSNYVEKTIYTNYVIDKNGNGDFTSIQECFNSISKATKDKQINIYLKDGIYNEINLTIPDYVNLYSLYGNKENCVIQGFNLPSATDDIITNYSTLNLSGNNIINGITVKAKNCRYAVHDESNGAITDWSKNIENCVFEHLGNQEVIDYRKSNSLAQGNVWQSWCAWGEGASNNTNSEFNNCEFIGATGGYGIHGHDGAIKPYKRVFNNCNFIAKNNGHSISVDSGTSSNYQKCLVIFNNCNANGLFKLQGTNPVDVRVNGGNIIPVDSSIDYNFKKGYYPLFTNNTSEYLNESGETIESGTIVELTIYGKIKKAQETTPLTSIVGVTIGDCNNGETVKVISKCFYRVQTLSTSVGTKYKVVNGKLIVSTSDTDKIVGIGVDHYLVKMLV